MTEAIVAGHLCVDITPEILPASATAEHFLAPGRLSEVGAAVISTGGAVSNSGIALHKLGIDVTLVARLGDDLIGKVTRDVLQSRYPALHTALRMEGGEPSSYTIVINPPGLDRTFLHCPGTNNSFGPEDVSDELLSEARLMHFGYPPVMRRMFSDDGVTLATLFKRAKARGITTSLDMTMPDPTQASGQADWRLILKRSLPYVDVFMPSVEELLYMLERARFDELTASAGAGMIGALSTDDVAGLGQQVLDLGAKVAVIKLGDRGLYVRTADDLAGMGRGQPGNLDDWQACEIWAPCFEVDVVNTTGAGDATIAGFLAAMLKGQSAIDSATSAVGVGACNCEAPDSNSGVRSWEETQRRIAAGWGRLGTAVDDDRWEWQDALGVWVGPGHTLK